MDNVLDPFDQLMFDVERATGVGLLPHPFWVYNRPVDIDGLRMFHRPPPLDISRRSIRH
jgi:diacylglycerol O-acyltransferase / wax synthase